MKDSVKIIAALVGTSLVSALLLAVISGISKPVIDRNMERKLKVAVLRAAGVSFDPKSPEAAFREWIRLVPTDAGDIYVSSAGKERVKAFEIRGPGFWGPISLVVAVTGDGEAIKGMEVLENSETPGLGARISEAGFLNQFKGKRLDGGIRMVSGGAAGGDNDVSAITGATMTSKAVERMLNEMSLPFLRAAKEVGYE